MTDKYELEQRLDKAEWVLNNAGFRRCDIPACNCGSWHQVGGFKARFDEIKEAIDDTDYSTNGKILLDVVKEIIAEAKRPRLPAQAPVNCGEPVAWMNSGHIEAYQSGKRDGMAWASPLESDFYSVALYAAPAHPAQRAPGWIDQNHQIDRYGVALMMIGLGCADPAELATRVLSEFGVSLTSTEGK